jgi:putative ATP-dependent endonuclease of OLD family
LLFRWASGYLEENIIAALSDDKLETLLIDPADEKTGMRLRTLADRLGIQEKDFESVKTKAGSGLKTLILAAASGAVPEDKTLEKKQYQAHAQIWFKTVCGGRELAEKIFSLGAWSALRPQLMPFCNALRKAVDLPNIGDIAP